MATTVTIDAQDVAAAGNFLEQFLSDSVPDGDFSRGTALRDLTVGALASVFAYLRADATQVRQLQSLTSVASATGDDPEALRDAVVAIMSNVFITPKGGNQARGVAVAHSTSLTDVFILTTHRFTYAAGVVFTVDADDTYFIPQRDLVPVFDAVGSILEYQFNIPLVAVKTGTDGNIAPGQFASFDRFNQFVSRVEAVDTFGGGKGTETVAELLERAPTAISVRNLINARSITAVLDDQFPQIRNLLVIGMADPEMQRDLLTGVAKSLALHIGGNVDIYLQMDLVETSFTGQVAAVFARPDNIVNIFRDPFSSFASVQVGDVIRISAGLTFVPAEHVVVENRGTELIVSERVPFASATDEMVPAGNVSYTIGRIAPLFNDVLFDIGNTPLLTGVTSRTIGTTGRIALPGGPVMDILDVAIINPPGAEAAFQSPDDGFVHFTKQVNTAPSQLVVPGEPLQYQIIVNNPSVAQSMRQWMEVRVGTDTNPTRWDGYNLRVRYRTLSGFPSVAAYVTDRLQRTVAADQLCRGHFPVTVYASIQYKLKSDVTEPLNDTVVAQTVIDFINLFNTDVAPIDVSAINTILRDTYPSMAAVLPFELVYILQTPTGEFVTYGTQDQVLLTPSKQTAGPVLDLLSLAVSDRTVRYIANDVSIVVAQTV